MKTRFSGQVVLIVGASGGLGRAFTDAFLEAGATLILAGRSPEALQNQIAGVNHPARIELVDITSPESVQGLCQQVENEFGAIDILVNAAGCDVRKSLPDHTPTEIRRVLDVDLLGPIWLTRASLPYMRAGHPTSIVHIGGFADGRLAFPYYSVDVAARAGLYSFIESMNRELSLEGSQVRLAFFGPSPADTAAERPFHPLWKKMGTPIVAPQEVAAALLRAIARRQTVSVMGGFVTRFFAKLNALAPALADGLAMNSYGKMLREFLYGAPPPRPPEAPPGDFLKKLAIFLVILSFILYGLIAAVPFLGLPLEHSAALASALVVGGEASWWVGVAIVGKEMVTKYRRYLNPCHWWTPGAR